MMKHIGLAVLIYSVRSGHGRLGGHRLENRGGGTLYELPMNASGRFVAVDGFPQEALRQRPGRLSTASTRKNI